MKKILSCFLVLSTFFTMSTAASYESDDSYSLLEKLGLPADAIELMDPIYRDSLLAMLQTNPEKVSTSISSITVNLAEELEQIRNTSDQELIESGLTLEEVEKLRQSVSSFNTMARDKDYITDSEMQFYMTVVDKSDEDDGKAVKYEVTIIFNWYSPFLIDAYDDIIGVSWGGELLESNISNGHVSYYEFTKPSTWKDYFGYKTMTLDDEQPNVGLTMLFPQTYNGVAQSKSGSFSFTLSANNRVGEESYVIARYGHRTAILGDTSITYGPPSVTIGSAYVQTPVERGRHAISY